MGYSTILFDFDGVLCTDRFYKATLLPKYPEVYEWIKKNIFGNNEIVEQWMRSEISSIGINKLISKNTNFPSSQLNALYEESVLKMGLVSEVVKIAFLLKQSGLKIGIVTNNMDVFTRFTVPNKRLDSVFDVVVNSADHGILKKEAGGKLFDVALQKLGEKIENAVMIDDSESTVQFFEAKGGRGHLYRNPTQLQIFLIKSGIV